MAVKIYVRQQAVIHADTIDELIETRDVAKRAIEEGGGAVEWMSDMQQLGDETYAQEVHYQALKVGL